jgi:hypothetical protein
MNRLSFAAFSLCAFLATNGCESGPRPSEPSLVRADASRLVTATSSDPTVAYLEEVDGFVDDRLPVRAGERLTAAVIPASRRLREGVEGTNLTTPELREMRRVLVATLRERERVMAQWAEALRLGESNLAAQLDALRRHRRIEERLVVLLGTLDETARTGSVTSPAPP